MPLITCPNVGYRKVFKYQMEKKHHLESKKCQGLPPETSNSSKSIVKRDNGYLCLLCNAEIKHSNNISRHKKLCKKGQKPLFTCDVCNKQFKFKCKLERHKQVQTRTLFVCNICSKSFKRNDHLKNHKEVCSEEAKLPTMVNMVNSDQIVPEFENHVDVPEHESIVDEVPNDFTDIVENIRHPVEDVPVCAVEVADLITEQEVPEFQTPPHRHHHQNRLPKSCQRRVFDINSMSETVKEKEREKILSRTMGNH